MQSPTSVSCQQTSRLTIFDKLSNKKYLIDTGSDISVLPFSKNSQTRGKLVLYAANNTPIYTYGEQILNLDLGLKRNFTWKFITADVDHPIIGADLLHHFGLLVDLKNNCLVDPITSLQSKVQISSIDFQSISTLCKDTKTKYDQLLMSFKEITNPQNLMSNDVLHNVRHYITTKGSPVFARPRRLDSNKLAIAKKEFSYMMENGICRPSKSSWASPLYLVAKSNGEWRPCGDYRKLNHITIPDRYPIPHVQDLNHNLHGKTVFSVIDLVRAYHQIPIAEEDVKKPPLIHHLVYSSSLK